MLPVFWHNPHARVKKLLGKMALNRVQRSFDLVTKIRTPEIILFMCIPFLPEVFLDPVKCTRLCCLRYFLHTKKKKKEWMLSKQTYNVTGNLR